MSHDQAGEHDGRGVPQRTVGLSRLTLIANRYAPVINWVSLAVIAFALMLIARTVPFEPIGGRLLNRVDSFGVWGPLVVGILYVVAVVLLLPGSALALMSGALFGLGIGLVTASLASNVGAAIAFLIARYFAREKVAEIAGRRPKFAAIDQAVAEGGWHIVVLLRLSPAVPFNLLNYFFGLTRVRFWPCVLASWLSLLPSTFAYVYIGNMLGIALEGERGRTTVEWVMLVLGLVATGVMVFYIARLAGRKLQTRSVIPDRQEDSELLREWRRMTGSQRGDEPLGWPWKSTILALLALVFLGISLFVRLKPDAVRGLFGPSETRSRESCRPVHDFARSPVRLSATVLPVRYLRSVPRKTARENDGSARASVFEIHFMSMPHDNQATSSLTIRAVAPDDVRVLLNMIGELAEYESLAHTLTVDEHALSELLFCPRPAAGAVIAWMGEEPAGFAVFCENVSTFLGARGIYIEDLFVRPALRGRGVGMALLRRVAHEARRRNARFLEWRVLDWNTSAITFYQKIGAEPLAQWIPFRLGPAALERLH